MIKINSVHFDDDGKPKELVISMSVKEAAFYMAFAFNLSNTAIKNASGSNDFGDIPGGAYVIDEIFNAFYPDGYHDVIPRKFTQTIHDWGQELNALT